MYYMESTAANIYKLMRLHLLSVFNNFVIETPVYNGTIHWNLDDFGKSNPTND